MIENHADLPQVNSDRPDRTHFERPATPHRSSSAPNEIPRAVPDDMVGKSFSRQLELEERLSALEVSLAAANDPIERRLLGDILEHYRVWYERTRGL